MSFEHSAVFDRPVGEVFAWHSRPGAIHRLMPPWQPVKVAREAGSLESGTAVLALPGGVKWVAAHRPDGYEAGRRFTDELTTPVLSSGLSWRHTHEFSEEPGGGTRVTDRVQTRLPERFLKQMFAYRTRQLGADLAAHARWPGPAPAGLTVAVTGSTGLIGSALTAFLSTGGHRVIRLVRSDPSGTDRLWRPDDPAPDLLEGVDALVHLAGASIAGRFTESHKQAVRASRVGPTRRLAELAAQAGVPVMVSASAIGLYGPDRGDEELTEEAGRGDGFVADVVADWEADTAPARQGGVRVALIRTGIVQSPRGGTLQLLRPLFEAGLGGRLGDGEQWTAWIGIDDLLDIYLRALVDPAVDGPVNAVAPQPVRNREYTEVLARVLRRPSVVPVPGFGPAALLGREGARELALASQRVVPARLSGWGHQFRHPDLEPALRHLLGRVRGDALG
ncbi:MAG TPA: TIGR01777 family oxidoreductase [Acidimicrobiales bacterium]|nr:TIGR01777 family oxidoreductase [Acidimicrobiales bacterium]